MNVILRSDFEQILPFINKESLFRSKWLITGATGMLGSYLTAFLCWLNEEHKSEMELTIIHRGNIIDSHSILGPLQGKKYLVFLQKNLSEDFTTQELEKYDYVIHAASNAAPKAYLEDPIGTLNTNVKATQYFLDELKDSRKLKCFLYFSSGEIYGEPEIFPTPEDYVGRTNHLHQRACYVEGKKFGEVLCANYFNKYKFPIKIVRPIHIFGPGFKKNDGRVWADFIQSSLNGSDIEILSDGKAQRGFCYISNALTQLLAVIQKGQYGQCYNIGNPNLTSIYELAETVCKVVNDVNQSNITVKIKNTTPVHLLGSPSISCPDIQKVKGLAQSLEFGLEEGIQRVVQWFLTERQDPK